MANPLLAKALRRQLARKNRWEEGYEAILKMMHRSGQVHDYAYEAMTLKLGPDCRYTPDFLVVLADGTVELHEVKGHKRDDAMVKLRVAAQRFTMFRFVLVTKDGTGWHRAVVEP